VLTKQKTLCILLSSLVRVITLMEVVGWRLIQKMH